MARMINSELHSGAKSKRGQLGIGTYHPPGSATAVSCASLTRASSNPFSDMSVYRCGPQVRPSYLSATRG